MVKLCSKNHLSFLVSRKSIHMLSHRDKTCECVLPSGKGTGPGTSTACVMTGVVPAVSLSFFQLPCCEPAENATTAMTLQKLQAAKARRRFSDAPIHQWDAVTTRPSCLLAWPSRQTGQFPERNQGTRKRKPRGRQKRERAIEAIWKHHGENSSIHSSSLLIQLELVEFESMRDAAIFSARTWCLASRPGS